MIHRVPGGHTFQLGYNGLARLTDDEALDWHDIDTDSAIIVGERYATIPLKGGYTSLATANEILWLASELGMVIADLGEGRRYIVAVQEKFFAEAAERN